MLFFALRVRGSAAGEYRADPLLHNDCTVLLPACKRYTDAQAPVPLHPAALLPPDHTISAAYASQRTQAPLKPSLLVFSGSLLPRLPVLSRELLDQLLRAQVT